VRGGERAGEAGGGSHRENGEGQFCFHTLPFVLSGVIVAIAPAFQ
jgi:hypothetical protein